MSLREKILSAKDLQEEKVYVKEWDVEIIVRGMNGHERAQMMNNSLQNSKTLDFEKLYPEILIRCCYDPETNEKLFQEADRDFLNKKSASALEKVSTVAMRLSGLDMKMDDAVKN